MPATTEKQRRFFGIIHSYCEGKGKPREECRNRENWREPQCHAWANYQKEIEKNNKESFCDLADEMAHASEESKRTYESPARYSSPRRSERRQLSPIRMKSPVRVVNRAPSPKRYSAPLRGRSPGRYGNSRARSPSPTRSCMMRDHRMYREIKPFENELPRRC